MTAFHEIVVVFNFVICVSESLRLYGNGLQLGDDSQFYLLTPQGALVLCSFITLVVIAFIPISDRILVGVLVVILPLFTASMYRWRDRFNDFYVYLQTRNE